MVREKARREVGSRDQGVPATDWRGAEGSSVAMWSWLRVLDGAQMREESCLQRLAD